MKNHYLRTRGFTPIGHDRLWQERVHDSYKLRGKLEEPAVCPHCRAVFHAGRWQWRPRPPDAPEVICPACHRIRDDFPAGYVTLSGPCLGDMRDELLHLIRNQESREAFEHALERIMGIDDSGSEWLVKTTDIHLARRIGEALQRAHRGTLKVLYNRDENLLHMHWDCGGVKSTPTGS